MIFRGLAVFGLTGTLAWAFRLSNREILLTAFGVWALLALETLVEQTRKD